MKRKMDSQNPFEIKSNIPYKEHTYKMYMLDSNVHKISKDLVKIDILTFSFLEERLPTLFCFLL